MTKTEKAKILFENNYNCAQAIIGAFSEEIGLSAETALKIANGFGGGVRCGELCGAASGAIMVIGMKCGFHIQNDLDQKNFCNKKTAEFLDLFKKENGSILCRDILGTDIRTPEDHTTDQAKAAHKAVCPAVVARAAALLETFDVDK